MRLVIDVSVALKWVVEEVGSEAADRLLDETLLAPDFWLIEAANALWSKLRRGELTRSQAEARLAKLQTSTVVAAPTAPLLQDAMSLAAELGHPVYDCLYLALAIAEETTVITADPGFRAAVQGHPALASRVQKLVD